MTDSGFSQVVDNVKDIDEKKLQHITSHDEEINPNNTENDGEGRIFLQPLSGEM